MKNEQFSIKKRIQSFVFAINGLKILLKEEHNARIHLLATFCAILCGFLLKFSKTEWLFVIISISLVFFAELINSAIENIADFIEPNQNITIKKIKDLAAASVLVCAINAFIIGSIIVFPKIFILLNAIVEK